MADLNPNLPSATPPVDRSLVSYTNVIYALHSLSVLIGLTTIWTIVGSFILGVPSIVAVIMNYVRRADVRGTFLESHFRWQIRTFWFAVVWAIVIWAVSLPLMLIAVGFVTLVVGYIILGLWVIYRIARGWMALGEHRAL